MLTSVRSSQLNDAFVALSEKLETALQRFQSFSSAPLNTNQSQLISVRPLQGMHSYRLPLISARTGSNARSTQVLLSDAALLSGNASEPLQVPSPAAPTRACTEHGASQKAELPHVSPASGWWVRICWKISIKGLLSF